MTGLELWGGPGTGSGPRCRLLLVATRHPSLSLLYLLQVAVWHCQWTLGVHFDHEIVFPCPPLVPPLCCLSPQLEHTCAEGSPCARPGRKSYVD